ncbi:hypothetical protein Naga_102749g1 [Nannochloropsis gaditana]|uniref:Uncharacterized protein n=1 Tax=Nannochloropsis gaditana TaxID=72520 RepID=W7U0C7_9STRA|nr:hypothetical protein Naga_102749g1 [Nannochloropsis gaditana]
MHLSPTRKWRERTLKPNKNGANAHARTVGREFLLVANFEKIYRNAVIPYNLIRGENFSSALHASRCRAPASAKESNRGSP